MILKAIRTAYYPNGVEADMFLRIQYETRFGIHDHYAPEDPNVPWPLMAVSPKEDMSVPDFMRLRLDQFAEHRVFEIFGLSFNDLMQYPRREFLQVLASAKAMNEKMGAGFNTRFGSLEKQINEMQKQAIATQGSKGR